MAVIVRLVEVKQCCTRKRSESIFKINETESAVLNSAGGTSSQEERGSRRGLVGEGGGG